MGNPIPPTPPARWVYDIDPATGISRATYAGEVQYSSGGSGVTSFNGRAGSVTLTAADVNGAGGPYILVSSGPFQQSTGVVNGSNAAAGQIGEFIVNNATGIVPVNGSAVHVTSINLTPGDWDTWGCAVVQPATANGTQYIFDINPLGSPTNGGGYAWIMGTTMGAWCASLAPVRASLTTPTTFYIDANITWGGGGCTVNAGICARRVR